MIHLGERMLGRGPAHKLTSHAQPDPGGWSPAGGGLALSCQSSGVWGLEGLGTKGLQFLSLPLSVQRSFWKVNSTLLNKKVTLTLRRASTRPCSQLLRARQQRDGRPGSLALSGPRS